MKIDADQPSRYAEVTGDQNAVHTDPAAGRGEQMRAAMSRYTAMLARAHRDDE